MHILVITSEWPTQQRPEWVPFIVQQVQALRQARVQVDVFYFRGAKNPVIGYAGACGANLMI